MNAAPTIIGASIGIRTSPWDVLKDVKTSTTNGITAPAISPYTIGAGTHAAIHRVSPKIPAANTIAPARIEAPESSAKLTRSPRDAKKMIAKMFPVTSSGW